MGFLEHKKNDFKNLKIAILTVSTTRTLKNDKSGAWISKQAKREGHEIIYYDIIPDDTYIIREKVVDIINNDKNPHALLITGGTGLGAMDVTIEAVKPLFDKELTAFGAIFAQLSFEQIYSAAILSRATAGIIEKSCVFCMPGSLKACKLACLELIFPEIGHVMKHIYEG